MADWGRADPIPRGETAGAREVWSAVGSAFFRELAKHLSVALGANLVYIGEVCRRPVKRMSALAVSKDGAEAEGFDYHLSGTASAQVLARGTSVHERGARRAFPLDSVLEKASAEASAGKALFDSRGESIGAIVAAWRHPLDDPSRALTMFEAFAPRAAAELERKRNEDTLRESEQRYHAFISENKDAMFRVEFEEPIPIELSEDEQIDRIYRYGYLAECNEATARLNLAPSAEAMIGARLEDYAPRSETTVDYLRNLIRSGYKADNLEVRHSDKAGGVSYRIRSHLGIVEKGKLLRIWVTTRDISDVKKTELKWQASERRFRQVLENIQMAAVMLDPEGQVQFCNDYVLEITGWSRDDLLGRNWFDLTIPEEDRERLRTAFLKCISDVQPYEHYQSVLVTRNGARRLIEWDRTLLRDADGKIIGTASLGRDVTDQRALEARLSEAERLESVGKFAGGIAHDFNNLLTIVRGYGDLLLEAHREADPLHDAAEEVIRASEQGAALTRQLLAFSRNQPIEAKPLNLNEAILDNENMVRRASGRKVTLILDLDPSSPTVLADPGQINQMLVNLAMNAHDAMPDGGKLTITSRTIELGETRPPGMPDVQPGAYVMLAVEDTGTGMPDEVRSHVFEPFYTTKRGRGTGLGLASVYGIVRQSGGYIAVDSAPGKGSTFRVLLPAQSGAGTATGGESAPKPRAEPATILLVDDEPALRGLAARVLRTAGYDVVEAGTGPEALAVAENYPKPIDLLLTDLSMPKMDGSEVAKRLKAARPGLKVLYMSGYTDKLPAEDYIQKPFTTGALAARVRDVLGSQGQ